MNDYKTYKVSLLVGADNMSEILLVEGDSVILNGDNYCILKDDRIVFLAPQSIIKYIMLAD